MKKLIWGAALVAVMNCGGARAADDTGGYAWLTGGGDVIGGSHGHHGGYGQFFAGSNGGFMALSFMAMSSRADNHCHEFSWDCSFDDTSIGETAFLVGGLTMNRFMYLAFGVSRVQVTGLDCQREEGHRTCVGAGLAGEVGWLVPNGPFGLEFRIFGDVNDVQSFAGTGIGLHFGGPRAANAPDFGAERARRAAEKAQRRAERAQERADRYRSTVAPRAQAAAGDLARLRANTPLYDRPARSQTTRRAPSEQPIVLKRFEENDDGRWWFVGMGSTAAWVLEADIVFDSH